MTEDVTKSKKVMALIDVNVCILLFKFVPFDTQTSQRYPMILPHFDVYFCFH